MDFQSDLAQIAREAAAYSGSGADIDVLEAKYAGLRLRLASLNTKYSWASPEDFATQLPTPEALRLIAVMDATLATTDSAGSDRPDVERLKRALAEVSGWATGVKRAYETLDRSGGSG